ncbi:ABC transporter ATP-binding protein [Enterococcus sp. DIV0242_7C1]|uniref:ABC-2 type transport system ATP-binding protein n=1 Tax=Candidatus Enterococcus dunnyi TaxID=1834192 RepID=A0A200JCQ6_9ENTE|nr:MULTISPECIES: ABC transporter ATP-binding protein [unclassified Enterococcus]MBO0469728.1 ABC transporter ATP-binding protein [Enterococcus sp. DIV0242_7C1]OUZ34983.1 hypothetical protein A5889_000458 [Enterococcus sp. 9D6_DIV0238]
MEHILEIKGVRKYFGDHMVLDELDLSITEPKIIALVAPNGTGKTTLLNIIANIDRPDEGAIEVLGKTNTDYRMFYTLSYLQDSSILYSNLTGLDHLEFIRKEHDVSKTKLRELIQELELEDYVKKKVKHYSLGMKQRLLLGVALLSAPKVLLMDEPLNGLDPNSILKIRKIMLKLNKQGVTIILSSHNLNEIEKITEDVYFLYDGRLITQEEVELETVLYDIVVQEIDKVLSFLSRIDVPTERLSDYKFQAEFSKQKLEVFYSFCKEEHIQILDQQLLSGYLETIYFNLFTDRLQVSP